MVGSNDEIAIVNFDETTLPDNKPRLTYRLAEKVARQVSNNVKRGKLRHTILMCIQQTDDQLAPPPSSVTTVDEVILNVDSVRKIIYIYIFFFLGSNNDRQKNPLGYKFRTLSFRNNRKSLDGYSTALFGFDTTNYR